MEPISLFEVRSPREDRIMRLVVGNWSAKATSNCDARMKLSPVPAFPGEESPADGELE